MAATTSGKNVHPLTVLRTRRREVVEILAKAQSRQRQRASRTAALMRGMDERQHRIDLLENERGTLTFAMQQINTYITRRGTPLTLEQLAAATASENIAIAHRLSILRSHVNSEVGQAVLEGVIAELQHSKPSIHVDRVVVPPLTTPITEIRHNNGSGTTEPPARPLSHLQQREEALAREGFVEHRFNTTV